MKKVVITIYGEDYASLANAAEHAMRCLISDVPSENIEWEDDAGQLSRVDYIVQEDATDEFNYLYGDEP